MSSDALLREKIERIAKSIVKRHYYHDQVKQIWQKSVLIYQKISVRRSNNPQIILRILTDIDICLYITDKYCIM